MKTYPVMLKMQGRLAVVVGCGGVGLRKVAALSSAGAAVRLVCGADDPGPMEGVEVIREDYRPEHLRGAFIVFACTNDSDLNSRIAADARDRGAMANAADQPADCDFYSPAVVRDRDVVIAIGTGGASPGLVQMLKARVGGVMPDGVGSFAAALDDLRLELKARVEDPKDRMRIMREISGEDAFEVFCSGGNAGLRNRFDRLLAGEDASRSLKSGAVHPLIRAAAGTAIIILIWVIVAHKFPGRLRTGHIAMVMLSFVCLAISAGAGLVYIRAGIRIKRHDAALLLGRTPSLEKLDSICRRFLTYGFCCLTITLALGLMRAMHLPPEEWFRNWPTHPKMTGAVVSWIILGLAFAAAWSPRFRGGRTAALSIAGLILVTAVMVVSILVVG